MMVEAFTLRVFLYGFIAFVPTQDGRVMTALIIDDDSLPVQGGHGSHSHDPLVGVAADEITCTPEENCTYVEDVDQTDSCRLDHWWRLQAELIEILPEDGAGISIVGSGSRAGLPVSQDDINDFGWTAQMKSIAPVAGKVQGRVIEDAGGAGRLNGRIDLRAGTIEACRLAGFPRNIRSEARVPAFYFESSTGEDSPQTQALAEVVMFRRRISGSKLRLIFRSMMDTRPVVREVELSPKRCREGDAWGYCIDLFIANEPRYLNAGNVNATDDSLFYSAHFPLYYDVSSVSGSPYPVHRRQRTNGYRLKPSTESNKFEFLCESPLVRRCIPIYDRVGSGAGAANRPICPVATFGSVAD